MKRITCETCGSNDIIKQEGYYICQSCLTKYTPEEAQKLIVEVEGTVKVDNSDHIERLLVLARRAFDLEDFGDANRYYNRALEEDPNNWEALFYHEYAWMRSQNLTRFRYDGAPSLTKKLDTIFSLIKKQPGDYFPKVLEVKTRVDELTAFYIKKAKEANNDLLAIYASDSDLVKTLGVIVDLQCELGDQLEHHFSQDKRLLALAVESWKEGDTVAAKSLQTNHEPHTKKIQKYEPDYQPLRAGCYIATSIYGSYDCPNVWTLRRFRDQTLQPRFVGKIIIKIYYLLSPALVKHFGQTNWFKTLFQKILDKLVIKLQARGVQNTPYAD